IETLWMARSDQQARLFKPARLPQLLESGEQNFFFTIARTARYDERRAMERERFIELPCCLFKPRCFRRLADVVFDVAAHAHPLSRSAEHDGTRGIRITLHGKMRHAGVEATHDKTKPPRARKRPLRNPPVDNEHWNPA